MNKNNYIDFSRLVNKEKNKNYPSHKIKRLKNLEISTNMKSQLLIELTRDKVQTMKLTMNRKLHRF